MKLVVAEDEKWVRLTIIKLIPAERLGLTIAGEASNGLEALELCKQLKPDILVTDIRMPGLNGLELIHELRQILSKIRIVIVSGYNDFEYAKAAMKYGITDYLLKPVDENELTQVLQRFKDSILLERNQLEEQELVKKQYKYALPLMHEKFLNQIVLPNSLTSKTINNTLNEYGIKLEYQDFMILVFSPDDISLFKSGRDVSRYKTVIKRAMRKFLGGITFSKASAEHELIVIVNRNFSDIRGSIEYALNLCSRIIRKHFGCALTIGISSTAQQVNKLSELYSQAVEVLEVKFWEGCGKAFFYRKGMLLDTISIGISADALNNISLNLSLSNCEPAFSYIDDVSSKLKNQPYVKPQTVKDFFWTFIQSVADKLDIYLPFIKHETTLINSHPYERLRNSSSIEDLNACAKDMIKQACRLYSGKNPESIGNVIENVKKLIDQNYSKDISLEMAAKHVHLSQAYLSELFKREAGIGFIDYKTSIRIENAKKLLTSTSMSINEICGKVGYTDPKYFSKLFKAVTGKTLSEYRGHSL